MARIGFHASHEQFPPSEGSRWFKLRKTRGSTAPCLRTTFVLGHLLKDIPGWPGHGSVQHFRVRRCPTESSRPPGYRYHPAVIAQGAATLSEMFPGRFWLALGSGQRLNEDIAGFAVARKG
jgi:coenzyme F420-dependent glucose-6-phosphate dehydrogenase